MPEIVITCPNTGKEVATGLSLDEQAFAREVLPRSSFKCLVCQQTHLWQKKDARLRQRPGASAGWMTRQPLASP